MEITQKLAAELCGLKEADELLTSLCFAAFDSLKQRLREGVTPEQCGRTFWVAAATLAARAWKESGSESDITGFSAGSVQVQMDREGKAFSSAAMKLLSPWLKDEGFSFMGVSS